MNKIIAKKIAQSDIETITFVKGKEEILSRYALYLIDESKMGGGSAQFLFFPKEEKEVAAIVSYLYENDVPFTVQGNRTGIVGGAIPFDGAVIAFDEMNKIIGIGFDQETQKWFVRTQPGLTLAELNDILKYKNLENVQSIGSDNKDWLATFQSDTKRYYYPIDPTETTAMIGGTVAANASGSRTFKYGATRKWVKRLHVILSSGHLLDIPRGKYFEADGKFIVDVEGEEIEILLPEYSMPEGKNAAGYYYKPDMDLIDLFIGSEGTLGVITEVELWIDEKPQILENILFFDSEEDAVEFVMKLREDKRLNPEYIEFMDYNCLELLRANEKKYSDINIKSMPQSAQAAIFFGIGYSEDTIGTVFDIMDELAAKCNNSLDNGWCAETEQEQDMFHRIRHAVPEIVNAIIAKRKNDYPSLHKLGTDMAVDDNHIKEMMNFYHNELQKLGLEYAIWGHIGNNHVHVNILPRNLKELEIGEELYAKFAKRAVEWGGTVSAEHGIGKIKKKFLLTMYGEKGIGEMKRVKKALDKKWLLNPGAVFDP